jgi:hypothetical protein
VLSAWSWRLAIDAPDGVSIIERGSEPFRPLP